MSDRMVADASEAPAKMAGLVAGFPCGPVVTRVSRWRVIASLQVAEALTVATSSGIWLHDTITSTNGSTTVFELLRFAIAVALLVHFIMRSMGAYDFATILNVWRSILTAAVGWILATAPMLAWAVSPQTYGDSWHTCFLDWVSGGAFILLVRLAAGYAATALLMARQLSHNVVVVGTGPEADACAELLQSDRSGANVVAFIGPDGECSALPVTDQADLARHADAVANLQRLIERHHVKDVIVATSERDRAQLPNLVRSLLCLPVRVLLWPKSIGVEREWVAASDHRIGDMPLLLASTPPLDGWHWVFKDVQDRVLAFLLLIFCAPPLLAIAIAIRLSSPGPILFRQVREGYNGKKFVILKFRTMNAAQPVTDQLILTAKHDSRMFPVGAFLRKTSLDELPQLLNVLRGDMWLVGPRPHSPLATAAGQRYSEAAKHYMARFRVKPGITGWAQVNGWRGATNTVDQIQQRVIFDLYYIENWSVWLDFKILLQTALKGFIHQNAY